MPNKKIEIFPVKEIKVKFDNTEIKEKVIGVIEREAKSFGNSARVDCPIEYLGKKVYLVICNS